MVIFLTPALPTKVLEHLAPELLTVWGFSPPSFYFLKNFIYLFFR